MEFWEEVFQLGLRDRRSDDDIPKGVTHEGNPTWVQLVALNVVQNLRDEGVGRARKV